MDESHPGPARVVAIGHRFPDASIESEVFAGTGVRFDSLPSHEFSQLEGPLVSAEVLLIGTLMKLDAERLASLTHLKGIVRYGIGTDNIDIPAAARLGIRVCNVPDYATSEVATHALALLLGLARQVVRADRLTREGQWLRVASELTPIPLEGKTLGVLGAGRIGMRLLEIASSLPWTRVAFDPAVAPEKLRAVGVVPASSINELLDQSNFLSLHAPPASAGPLLTETGLRRLPHGAIIVNCARGSLIDSEALAHCLRDGAVGGAGLDVLEQEPMPENHPLRNLDNVVVTGHSAWLSERSKRSLRMLAAEEALRLVRGLEPLHPVLSGAP